MKETELDIKLVMRPRARAALASVVIAAPILVLSFGAPVAPVIAGCALAASICLFRDRRQA